MTERPEIMDEAIIKEAIQKILHDLMGYMTAGNCTMPESEIEEALIDVINYENMNDGFQLAMALKDYGWDVDRELMDILDGLDIYSVHDRRVRAWATANNITAKYKIGDRVKITDHAEATAGVIEDHYPDRAMYVVHGDVQPKGSSWVIEYEKVSDADSVAVLPDATEQVPTTNDHSSEASR
jgi:hypothetical protein